MHLHEHGTGAGRVQVRREVPQTSPRQTGEHDIRALQRLYCPRILRTATDNVDPRGSEARLPCLPQSIILTEDDGNGVAGHRQRR